MAGTVRGSRQMNSTVLVSPGSRSRTQVIVGTSSRSMTTTVKSASAIDDAKPSANAG
jgi:hypothetical protein